MTGGKGSLSILCSKQQMPNEDLARALQYLSLYIREVLEDGGASNVNERCILCSLTAAEFLRSVGFSADVVSVIARVWVVNFPSGNARALDFGGKKISDIGGPAREPAENLWAGHLIAAVGDGERRYLIETTLRYPRSWLGPRGTVVMAIEESCSIVFPEYGYKCLSEHVHNYTWGLTYFLNENNRGWENAADTRDFGRWKRAAHEMASRFQQGS